MQAKELKSRVRASTPALSQRVDALVANWLAPLLTNIDGGGLSEFRPKQVNDPIWGTIELLPWEVALLDTKLLQRMRGVRQLGLAQLVFPSASYDRLEHIIGTVGAVEETLRALSRQIERWNRDARDSPLPSISDKDRYAIRVAALLHDIGHGPFSHAIEPVLQTDAALPSSESGVSAPDWRDELNALQALLKELYQLNASPSVSEAIAVMMVFSTPLTKVLASDAIFTERGRPAEELQAIIVAAIIGAVDGPGASHLSALISSQIDADKLDYLARDAYHAGLEIGFDTSRLLARLELLAVRADNLDDGLVDLRKRASESPDGRFYQIGIAAAGFGSFEQMLIGRTFLYDRLYHHHKVRAAEAMAQRLILIAERDRKRRFELDEIFLGVADDTFLSIFAKTVSHPKLAIPEGRSAPLAESILSRDLLHRAFAFRGRFIATPPGQGPEEADKLRQDKWRRIVKAFGGLKSRYEIGQRIFDLAVICCDQLKESAVEPERMDEFRASLENLGPEHIIVDLPALKADAIRILARYPNGALKVPEFSFNPVKWADAYELQKRTGYIFCPRSIVPIISVASRIFFLREYGVTMAVEADGYIKAAKAIPSSWLSVFVARGVIDEDAAEHLSSARFSLLSVRASDLKIPEQWISANPDLAYETANSLNKCLSGGLTSGHLEALGKVIAAICELTNTWFSSDRVTRDLDDENALQQFLKEGLELQGLKTQEGTVVGGGKLDLFVEDAILIENKFHDVAKQPDKIAKTAGMQGRRYAIALNSQLVFVIAAYKPAAGQFPDKWQTMEVREISASDPNRAEIRFILPYGAVRPSSEKAK